MVLETEQGYQNVVIAKETELTDVQVKEQITDCDVFLLGTLSTSFTPAEQDGIASAGTKDKVNSNPYSGWLRYATCLGKKRVHLSLRAPYDIVIMPETLKPPWQPIPITDMTMASGVTTM
ncbi:TPA: hypothetical protein ACPZHQ_003850 [Yersinia enterocolitica]